MEVYMQLIKISELKPCPQKDSFFDDITGEPWEKLLKSIQISGVIEPIIITQDKVIISGHQRVRAYKELNIKNIPYVLWNGDPSDKNAIIAAFIWSNKGYIQNKQRYTSEMQNIRRMAFVANYNKNRNKIIQDIKRIHYETNRKYVNDKRDILLNYLGNKCEICGNNCKNILHIHFRIPLEEWGTCDSNNLMATCPNCHAILHKCIEEIKNSYNVDLPQDIADWTRSNYSYDAVTNCNNEITSYIVRKNDYNIDVAINNINVLNPEAEIPSIPFDIFT